MARPARQHLWRPLFRCDVDGGRQCRQRHHFSGDDVDILYGDNAAGTETGDDFIWAGGGGDYLVGGNGTDTLAGGTGVDYCYGGAGTDCSTCTPTSPQENPTTCSIFRRISTTCCCPSSPRQRQLRRLRRLCLWLHPAGRRHELHIPRSRRHRGAAAGGDAVHLTVLSSSTKGPEIAPRPFRHHQQAEGSALACGLGDFGGGLVRDNPRCNAWLAAAMPGEDFRWANGQRIEASGGVHL